MGFYEPRELELIVRRSASILEIPTDAEGAGEIARRCRGTPASPIVFCALRDFAQIKGQGVISGEIARYALDCLRSTRRLDAADRRLLTVLIEKFDGGPVGLENLAISVGEELDTLTDVSEPFLIQAGFIVHAARPARPSPKAYTHLWLTPRARTSSCCKCSVGSSSGAVVRSRLFSALTAVLAERRILIGIA